MHAWAEGAHGPRRPQARYWTRHAGGAHLRNDMTGAGPPGDEQGPPRVRKPPEPEWPIPEPRPPQRSLRDWLWPKENSRYWFALGYVEKPRKAWKEWIHDRLFGPAAEEESRRARRERIRRYLSGAVAPEETLDQARDVAQSAAERSAAAERRASTLSGAVAIAASLTVGGAGIVLDRSKVPDQGWRLGFAVAFALVTLMFVLAGLYAARALVTFRKWGLPHPYLVVERRELEANEQRLARAAEMLDDFTFSWEVSDAKLRAVDSSFRAFTIALLLLVVIAVGFAVYQGYETTPPPAKPRASLLKAPADARREAALAVG